uniref:Coiled-coil_56 domain-containing protein n=1 Tax=Panagrellus redivivus TaxID=6233 RepID=A0A7E4W6H8_PANRE
MSFGRMEDFLANNMRKRNNAIGILARDERFEGDNEREAANNKYLGYFMVAMSGALVIYVWYSRQQEP